MRKVMLTLLAGPSLMAMGASADALNSPGIDGYLARGRMMWADRNYEGCIDQMLNVVELGASGERLEEARRYMALAAIGMDEEGALTLLRQWLTDYPDSPHRQEGLMAVGDIYFNAGSYKEAVDAYDKVDVKALDEAKRGELTYRKAYSLLMLGSHAEAARLFEDLSRTPEYGNAAKFYLGYIAYARKDYARALELLRRVDTATAPGNAAPYYMAQIYYVEGDNRNALEQARKAIAANLIPQFTTESKRIAGESLYALGDRDGAVAYLWDYAANASDRAPSAFYILGVNEWDKGDYKAAGKLLQQATKQDDAMGQSAYLYLGQAYLKEGNTNAALMAFEKAYRMEHDAQTQETAFYNYAVAKSNGGKAPFESSAAIFEDFLERYPRSRYRSNVERYVITGYMNDGDYEAALRTIDKVKNPSAEVLAARKRSLFALATKDMTAGNPASALPRLRESRAIDAGEAALTRQAMLWEGDCLYQLGRPAEAVEAYNDFLKAAPAGDPNRGLALYDLGYARYELHDYAAARADLTAAVNTGSLDSRMSADARCRIGDCLYYEKKYAEAGAQYRSAAETSPETADYALFQNAVMSGLTGDNRTKISGLETMMTRFPASAYVPDALLEKASAQSATGDPKGAAATYGKLLNDYPLTAQGRRAALLLALDSRNAGDTADAMAGYKRVITDYPSSEEARVAADDLKTMMANADRLDEYVAFMNSVPGAPAVEQREIDSAAFRAAERRYLEGDNTEALLAYIGRYPGGVYEADALYYLAENAEDKGNVDDAVEYARRVVENHPKSTVTEDALAILAKGLITQGNSEEALAAYRRLEQTSSNPRNLLSARMGIMTNSLRSDDNATVIETADKVLASGDVPTGLLNETRFMRGVALHRTGRTAEAENEWASIAGQTGDVNGSKSAVYLAESILSRGDAKGAESAINRFIDSKPQQEYWLARGFVVLSDALRAQGKTFEADQYLKTLRDNYPGKQPDIYLMIDERLNPATPADTNTPKTDK